MPTGSGGPGSRAWWLMLLAYVLGLLGAQPFLGFAVDAFKERWGEGGLEATVWVVAALGGATVLAGLVQLWRRATRLERFTMALGLVLYGVGVVSLEIPQERLHYLEYGLLAGLVYAGLHALPGWRRAPAAVVAFLIAGGLGYLDETLQGALWERRYFDWRDVALNARASALGVLVAAPVVAAWQRERPGGPPESA